MLKEERQLTTAQILLHAPLLLMKHANDSCVFGKAKKNWQCHISCLIALSLFAHPIKKK